MEEKRPIYILQRVNSPGVELIVFRSIQKWLLTRKNEGKTASPLPGGTQSGPQKTRHFSLFSKKAPYFTRVFASRLEGGSVEGGRGEVNLSITGSKHARQGRRIFQPCGFSAFLYFYDSIPPKIYISGRLDCKNVGKTGFMYIF